MLFWRQRVLTHSERSESALHYFLNVANCSQQISASGLAEPSLQKFWSHFGRFPKIWIFGFFGTSHKNFIVTRGHGDQWSESPDLTKKIAHMKWWRHVICPVPNTVLWPPRPSYKLCHLPREWTVCPDIREKDTNDYDRGTGTRRL